MITSLANGRSASKQQQRYNHVENCGKSSHCRSGSTPDRHLFQRHPPQQQQRQHPLQQRRYQHPENERRRFDYEKELKRTLGVICSDHFESFPKTGAGYVRGIRNVQSQVLKWATCNRKTLDFLLHSDK